MLGLCRDTLKYLTLEVLLNLNLYLSYYVDGCNHLCAQVHSGLTPQVRRPRRCHCHGREFRSWQLNFGLPKDFDWFGSGPMKVLTFWVR